ncbi:Flagellar hook-basal body complex protein FliE [gamma proteobacterium IMCC2047]|nr:Flagellar hook-basal body complex protein FliE [gamma proteobacterium IMCC2047]
MNVRADINSVLMQMRDMQAQAQGQVNKPAELNREMGVQGADKTEGPGFGEMLSDAVNGVNDAQKKAGALATAYEQGDPNVDLTQVMISMQKASVSFQAMTQVRNRLVSAYETVMKMPV